MFRYLLLGLLRDGACLHGYALMKEYRKRSGGSAISSGNFYRELQRLLGEGLVRPTKNPPGADPRRTPYEITAAGVDAFDTWFSAPPAAVGNYEDEVSARAIFLSTVDAAVVRAIMDRWHDELWMRSKVLERAHESCLVAGSGGSGEKFQALAVLSARRLKHIAADMEFLDELRAAYTDWLARPRKKAGGNAPRASSVRAVRRRPRQATRERARTAAGAEVDDDAAAGDLDE